jgi:rhodanese-related sulfurtransferase
MEHQSAIEVLLAQARARMDRVEPERIADEVAAGAILVDIRPVEQRQRDGELAGAVIIDRNVLEWRLDPTSPDRLPLATGADIRYVVVCNEGYSSSLAAATLRDLGLHRATDLVGGFQALLAISGRPSLARSDGPIPQPIAGQCQGGGKDSHRPRLQSAIGG